MLLTKEVRNENDVDVERMQDTADSRQGMRREAAEMDMSVSELWQFYKNIQESGKA